MADRSVTSGRKKTASVGGWFELLSAAVRVGRKKSPRGAGSLVAKSALLCGRSRHVDDDWLLGGHLSLRLLGDQSRYSDKPREHGTDYGQRRSQCPAFKFRTQLPNVCLRCQRRQDGVKPRFESGDPMSHVPSYGGPPFFAMPDFSIRAKRSAVLLSSKLRTLVIFGQL